MRLVAINLLLFLYVNISYGYCEKSSIIVDTAKHAVKKQYRPRRPPPPPDNIYYDDCVFKYRYTTAQRLRKYPYSKAVKILAVSYPCYCAIPHANIIINKPDGKKDTIDKAAKDTLPKQGLLIYNGVLNQSDIKEIKTLTSGQINQLTNIIYNTDVKVHQRLGPYLVENGGGGCFEPRNALVFINKDGKVFDYFEICFECHVADSKSREITLGSGCNQKFELLRQYLISLGIKYGTINKN
jgi:hypothetical protein